MPSLLRTNESSLTSLLWRVAGAILVIALAALGWAALAAAEPVLVRHVEGVSRGFPVLRSLDGRLLARGDLIQVVRRGLVESRLVFRFTDGSIHDEVVTFSQDDGVFILHSYRLLQQGPSFPETVEGAFDRATERWWVRYRADEDSPEETLSGRLELPGDVYNGMLGLLVKNLPAGRSATVQIVAFTPRPRLVKMLLAPVSEDLVMVGERAVRSARWMVRPQLGLVASLLVADLPDIRWWIAEGEAPGFLKFEGPLYFMGPVWRVELN